MKATVSYLYLLEILFAVLAVLAVAVVVFSEPPAAMDYIGNN